YATLKRHYGRWITLEGESELARFASLAPTLFGTEEGDEIVPSGRRERDNSRQAADPASKSQCAEGDMDPPTATARPKKVRSSRLERARAGVCRHELSLEGTIRRMPLPGPQLCRGCPARCHRSTRLPRTLSLPR